MKIQKFIANSKFSMKSLPENLLNVKVHFSNNEEMLDLKKV
jgi:hypothetical protein